MLPVFKDVSGWKQAVLGGLLLASVFLAAVYIKNNFASEESGDPIGQSISALQPPPENEPFAELTIPYLRNRDYQSRLGSLQIYSEKENYSSFLTSYDSDGLKINALLTRPKGSQPAQGWPAIVFIHGYIQPQEYRTTERYQDYVDYFARNGFVVFKIDLRGHGSSDGEATGAYYSSDYIIDTLNAMAALQDSNFVDRENIGLWGHSMAGNVVLRSMVVKPEIPAGVIWAGAVYTYEDFGRFGISDASYRRPPENTPRRRYRDQLFEAHGQFNPDSNFWSQVSPADYLVDLRGAIQLHHAINDDVVDIRYSRNLTELLSASGAAHQFFEYSSGGHNLSGGSFSEAMQRSTGFFREHLQ